MSIPSRDYRGIAPLFAVDKAFDFIPYTGLLRCGRTDANSTLPHRKQRCAYLRVAPANLPSAPSVVCAALSARRKSASLNVA
jgi:hypothetical protein